jgi:DNA modification methylase
MPIPQIDSSELPNNWRTSDDVGNVRRGLPFKYSYVGSFSQSIAEYFIRTYSFEGDILFDPFSGRGTVAMQALYHKRNMICNDMSPYSNTLCHSILWTPDIEDVIAYINVLQDIINDDLNNDNISTDYVGKGQLNDIAKLYHPKTFVPLIKLRNLINSNEYLLGETKYKHEIAMFVRACMTQLMLGQSLTFTGLKIRGSDNTDIKGILKYHEKLKETPKEVDIFQNLKDYIEKMNLNSIGFRNIANKQTRKLIAGDARHLKLPDKCIDGVITSPPYFHVLNYGQANWARLWALDNIGDPLVKADEIREIPEDNDAKNKGSEIYGKLYDKSTNSTMSTMDNVVKYSTFTGHYLKELYRVLKDDAFAIIVVGDYGAKKKIAAHRIVTDRAEIFGFKPVQIIMDKLNSAAKASSQYNKVTGGGKNDYDVCVVLYKGNYVMKNNPEDIDFRWSAKYADRSQRSIEEAWG